MIDKEKIQELLDLPAEERRRLVRLLESSLREGEASGPEVVQRPSPAAQWLLAMAGRYSGGPGDTAARADDILRTEIDRTRGFTTT